LVRGRGGRLEGVKTGKLRMAVGLVWRTGAETSHECSNTSGVLESITCKFSRLPGPHHAVHMVLWFGPENLPFPLQRLMYWRLGLQQQCLEVGLLRGDWNTRVLTSSMD
jgi:hypothetical protein